MIPASATPSSLSFHLVLITISIPLLFLPSITFLLALIATIVSRQRLKALSPRGGEGELGRNAAQRNDNSGIECSWSSLKSGLYAGRVSHARFQPVVHSFSYPLFFCFVDLDEIDLLFGTTNGKKKKKKKEGLLWPLNMLVNFNEGDHLKNGEGLSLRQKQDDCGKVVEKRKEGENEAAVETCANNNNNYFRSRVERLIQERTNNKFRPTAQTHRIAILTHLTYYGYCFNPVSFYYVFKRCPNSHGDEHDEDKETLEAIVAEVSNTPWNEMKCYVLHPDSTDVELVRPGRSRFVLDKNSRQQQQPQQKQLQQQQQVNDDGLVAATSSDKKKEWKSINYIFRKTFHVSPFMEMNYMYDWTFWDPSCTYDNGDTCKTSSGAINGNTIIASTTMRKKTQTTTTTTPKQKNENDGTTNNNNEKSNHMDERSTGTKDFTAHFEVKRQALHPMNVCWQMIRFPVYCFIIQLWIHYEAIWLFVKGVQFIPHPEGSETTASRIIGNIMVPFFALKDWLDGSSSTTSTKSVDDRDKKKKQKTV